MPTEEKRPFIQRLFTRIAPRYDWFNRLASCGLDQHWRKTVVERAGIQPNHRVLDVCAGTGDLAILCATRQRGVGLVVGLDMNRAMLTCAQRKQRAKQLAITWFEGDAEALPFTNDSFDRVVVGFSTRNLTNLTNGLREMVRVLRPNGQLVILETGHPANPIVWLAYQAFLFTVARVVGFLVTGEWWPFTYLAKSVRQFLTPPQVMERLQSVHAAVQYLPLSCGLASVYLATKLSQDQHSTSLSGMNDSATIDRPRWQPHEPPTSSTLDQALTPIRRELDAVTERLLEQLDDPVARNVVYLITAGGKRLRPALVLLTGLSGRAPNRRALIDTATAVELIHTATLIHDDIIDQSQLRRAQPTFHERWGTERALLMGDYLHSTAFRLLAQLQVPEVMGVMADVCQQLCRGELREVEARYRLDLREDEYLEIIRDKTASLISGCCQVGAQLGGYAPDAIRHLAAFGLHLGLAFQIIDDCLDLTGDTRELGKSIHADLDKGALSLPIIYLTQTLSTTERDRLFAPLREHATDPEFLTRIAQAAASAGAIARAQRRAAEFARTAQELVAQIPLNGLMGAYQQLSEYAVSRRS